MISQSGRAVPPPIRRGTARRTGLTPPTGGLKPGQGVYPRHLNPGPVDAVLALAMSGEAARIRPRIVEADPWRVSSAAPWGTGSSDYIDAWTMGGHRLIMSPVPSFDGSTVPEVLAEALGLGWASDEDHCGDEDCATCTGLLRPHGGEGP